MNFRISKLALGHAVCLVTLLLSANFSGVHAQEGSPDPTPNVEAESYTLTVSSDKSSICAGAVSSDPHQATITVTLTDEDDLPVSGATVNLSVETLNPDDTPCSYPATLSATSITTSPTGEGTVTLTSSRKIEAKATVSATYDEYEDDTTVTMGLATATWAPITNSTLLADGESKATLGLTLTFNGAAVDGHSITWRIGRILDDNDEVVFRVQPAFGSNSGAYGTIDAGPDVTPATTGKVETEFTAGTEGGTVEIQALDDTVVWRSPYVYDPGEGGGILLPTKIDVKDLVLSGTHTILNFPSKVYAAHYKPGIPNKGSLVVDSSGLPASRRMNATFTSNYHLMSWPPGRDMSGISSKYTWKIVKDSTVKKEDSTTVSGMNGAVTISTPNTVGIYDLKHYIAIKQYGTEKGRLNGETTEFFSTYGTPTVDNQFFTRNHLRKVVGWAQNTNTLNENDSSSTPYSVLEGIRGTSDYNYEEGTSFSTPQQWWNIINGVSQVNPADGKTIKGGDCDDYANTFGQAVALLGIGSTVQYVQGPVNPSNSGQRQYFWMQPTPTGPWNYHAVAEISEGSKYCYSITQSLGGASTYQTGTLAQMRTVGGPVIHHLEPNAWFTRLY